jgi:hypothetical protein
MSTHDHPWAAAREGHHHRHSLIMSQGFWRRWFAAGSLCSGLLAGLWLLLRSGTKPSRLAYPCQQAAYSTATLTLGVPLVSTVVAARRRLLSWLRTPVGLTVAALGLFLGVGVGTYVTRAAAYHGPQLDPPRDYRAQLYHVTDCPQDPVGDRFPGLDTLLRLMGRGGLKLYQSPTTSLLSGPDGIIAPDDTVVIKINYQWGDRGGTNTDLLRGLIRSIVDHPDTFTGEVVVCENAQFNSVENFDRANNNAQDHGLSPHDVVAAFSADGYRVSAFDWTALRYTSVSEYSAGDVRDGYIVGPYNTNLQGRVSYPKFQTSFGTRISLKYGLLDAAGGTYDREHLKFINVPVLKSHHATYGATACIKHYMGVVTRELSTNSHSAIARGILGALRGEIGMADLNILDCIWINANPYSGPDTTYAGATRRDTLVASTDPVATDMWAVTNILIPAFIANGYSPPWPVPSADPANPSSAFRIYLDHSMSYILAAGYNATNNLAQIDALTWLPGDLNCDGAIDNFDITPFVLALTATPPDYPEYYAQFPNCDHMLADVNGDGLVNNFDITPFVRLLTGP